MRRAPQSHGDFVRMMGRDYSKLQGMINNIVEKKFSLVSNQDISFQQGPPEPGNDSVYAKKYDNSIWVYVACSLISEAAASLPIKVYREVNSGEGVELQEVTSGLAYELLKKPSLHETPYEFKLALVASICYAGNSYIYVDTDSKEWFVLRPQDVNIVADRIDFISHYVFRPNQSYDKSIKLDAEKVVHAKLFSAQSYFYGTSPLQAAYKQCILTEMDTNYWIQFWKSGGRVMGAWKVDRALSTEQYKRFEARIKTKYRGMENIFRDILLENGMSFQQLGIAQKDAQLIEKYKLSRDDILAAYKVPSALANVLELANYSNMEVQEENFWKFAVMPKLTLIEEALNSNTILSENGRLVFKFDTSSIEALQRTDKNKAETGEILIRSSQMTPNEVRKRYWQMPAIPGDGDILKPVNPTPLPFTLSAMKSKAPWDAFTPNSEEAKLNTPWSDFMLPEKPKIIPKLSVEEKVIIAKEFDSDLEKHDNVMLRIFKDRFEKQKQVVMENLREQIRKTGRIKPWEDEVLLQGVNEVDFENHVNRIRNEQRDISKFFGDRTAKKLRDATKSVKAIGFDATDPSLSRYIQERSFAVAGVTDRTTLEMFRQGLASIAEEDFSISAATNYVNDFFGVMETWRANMIARTETAAVANKAIYQTFLQNDDIIEFKEWVTAGDSFVRDEHAALGNMGPIPLKEKFSIGGLTADAPNGFGDPGQDINCRCTLAVKVRD